MTAKERAAKLGYAVATYPDDAQVEIRRSEIAEAIRAAVLEERREILALALAEQGASEGETEALNPGGSRERATALKIAAAILERPAP